MIRSLDESNNWQQSDIASPLGVTLFHASFYIILFSNTCIAL